MSGSVKEKGEARVCELVPTQPQSRGASGEARLDDRDDVVEIAVRDLAHPSYFGRDVVTGGSFNLYEVWLNDPGRDHRICLGSLRREGVHWHMNRTTQVPVQQFDQVLITAEHDTCPAVSSGSVVMVGCCCDV